MILPRGPSISAGPAASSQLGQAHFTSPLWRVCASMRVCASSSVYCFTSTLSHPTARTRTSTFSIELCFWPQEICKACIETGSQIEIIALQSPVETVKDSPDHLCSYKSRPISLNDQSDAGAIQPLISLIHPGQPLPLLFLSAIARSKLFML